VLLSSENAYRTLGIGIGSEVPEDRNEEWFDAFAASLGGFEEEK